MKRGLLLGVMSVLMFATLAQNQEALQKIESAKIALITERLGLTPDQAEKFWPIYNEFQNKQREISREFRQARENFDPRSATEEENKKMLEIGMRLKQNKLDLEQEYTQRMLQVINSRQMMNLRKAEDDFREMLLRRVRERNQRRDKLNNDRNLNQQRKQRKNN